MASRILPMLGHGLRLKCPRCGVGSLYPAAFRMHSTCPHCGLVFEREQGYFIGAIYINYAATVLIAVPGFFLFSIFTDLTINQQLVIWVSFAIIFPLLFFHHSRSLWLVLDHLFNPAENIYPVPPKKSVSEADGSNRSSRSKRSNG
jgi:uncharacterized protein (DUF983 family)